jgi:hypothetical protein
VQPSLPNGTTITVNVGGATDLSEPFTRAGTCENFPYICEHPTFDIAKWTTGCGFRSGSAQRGWTSTWDGKKWPRRSLRCDDVRRCAKGFGIAWTNGITARYADDETKVSMARSASAVVPKIDHRMGDGFERVVQLTQSLEAHQQATELESSA